MTKLDNAVFKHPVFGSAKARNNTPAWRAAEGLGTIFASMLAREMRQALAQDGKGLAGTGGADAGLYGAFFDQAMGKALDQSAAMAPFNALIERSIVDLPHSTILDGSAAAPPMQGTTGGAASDAPERAVEAAAGTDTVGTPQEAGSIVRDALGPVLLPPRSSYMAPILPPPTALKG